MAILSQQIISQEEISTNQVQSSADNLIGKPAQEVKKIFDNLPKLIAQRHNSLIDVLASTSGAASIGTTRVNVQADLDTIRGDIGNVVLGSIPDGTITPAKLNDTIKAQFEAAAAHGTKIATNTAKIAENATKIAANSTAITNNTNSINAIPTRALTMSATITAGGSQTLSTRQVRNITISPNNPSGGSSGDLWFKYS